MGRAMQIQQQLKKLTMKFRDILIVNEIVCFSGFFPKSSNVNQIMQRVSTMKKGSVTSGTSSSTTFVPLAVVLNSL